MELLKINYLFGWLENHRSMAEMRKNYGTVEWLDGRTNGKVEAEKYDWAPAQFF